MPDFEEDDYERRQRGRQRRRSHDDDEFDDYDDYAPYQAPPQDRVKGPGIAMFAVGLLHTILLLGATVVCGVLFATHDQPIGQGNNDEPEVSLIIGVICAVAGVYFGFITYGGWLMSRCRSYKTAMTASIMCIGSIACLGLSSVLIMPFGIWALVVLNDERVKQAFRGPLRERRRDADEDWDE